MSPSPSKLIGSIAFNNCWLIGYFSFGGHVSPSLAFFFDGRRRDGSRPAHPYHRAGIRVRCRAGGRSNGRNENLEKERAANIDISEALSICSEQFRRSTHMPLFSYAEANPPLHRLPFSPPHPIPSTGKNKRRSPSSRLRSRITKAAAKRRRPTRSNKRSMPSGPRPRRPHSPCSQYLSVFGVGSTVVGRALTALFYHQSNNQSRRRSWDNHQQRPCSRIMMCSPAT